MHAISMPRQSPKICTPRLPRIPPFPRTPRTDGRCPGGEFEREVAQLRADMAAFESSNELDLEVHLDTRRFEVAVAGLALFTSAT